MKDNELIDLLASRLEAASAAAGWNYIVLQKDQPTAQGIPSEPAIFFEKLFDHHHGSPSVKDEYRTTQNDFLNTTTQVVETTFQISALSIQDPKDLTIPTASDIVNYLKMFVQSRSTINLWKASGASMMRVREIRNPYFQDDHTKFEANPSFDLIIQHERFIEETTPVVESIVGAPSPIPNDPNSGVFPVIDDAGEFFVPI